MSIKHVHYNLRPRSNKQLIQSGNSTNVWKWNQAILHRVSDFNQMELTTQTHNWAVRWKDGSCRNPEENWLLDNFRAGLTAWKFSLSKTATLEYFGQNRSDIVHATWICGETILSGGLFQSKKLCSESETNQLSAQFTVKNPTKITCAQKEKKCELK